MLGLRDPLGQGQRLFESEKHSEEERCESKTDAQGSD